MKNISIYMCLIGLLMLQTSCKKMLEVSPNSEFAPSNVLTSENGIRSLLFSAYAEQQTQQNSRFVINDSEVCTDMAFNSGGAENAQLLPIINFTWNTDLLTFQADVWAPNYRCIRDANGVIENIDNVNTSDARKRLFRAEARVLRAHAYAILYNWFGPVPLRTSTSQDANLARATDDEMKAFIEGEISQSIADLPDPGREEAYGRFNKGNANGILAKFFLNTKQWQKAADAAKAVIDFNYYSTTQLQFKDLFKVENEGINNKEMMLVLPCRNEVDFGNWFMAGALPPAFKSTPQVPEFIYQATMSNFATQYRLRTAFVNSMAANDRRRSLICTSYINSSNATINILTGDNARSFKYFDNATIGNNSGNDVPLLRYADILMARAEALNELSAVPSTECFSLINQVRARAGINNLTLTDAPTKDAFRDAIFRERGWEFISEGKRREDLIRQGTFLSAAISRGISANLATNNKLLFPIPQSEIQANNLIVQNPGY
ncbi:RagB/SusD family nutrient uptake outer membrane protein [Pedobacter sandarakinus]|uniref:RagB/SusD family nutrient uptake outer membrane protein n=1 Tax=Pedobacter sandarakinus TaxID=353156 RepID=UPI002246259E|nr:RagB/SusD family nutrient uptake outer membrane protein [Pedobacter sandarakinus]MCX2575450.1 RagB/SusD family nutrient uptake outer membrane protein [Pedobacter sandarakinus]